MQMGNGASSLLYIGAGLDVEPLRYPAMVRHHSRFIFLDSRPYKASVMDEIAARLSQCFERVHWDVQGPDYVTFDCDDRAGILHYFTNMDDLSMFNSPVVRDMLPDVVTLFQRGFQPDASTYGSLPSLGRIFTTEHCYVPERFTHLVLPYIRNVASDEETDSEHNGDGEAEESDSYDMCN